MKGSLSVSKARDSSRDRQIVLKLLPKLLEEDVGFRARVAGLLAENLTTREETHQLFEEIKLLREETAKHFEEMRADMNARFEAVDRRFEMLVKEMRDGFLMMGNRINALGGRWSLASETAFRNAMKDLIEKEFGGNVTKWHHVEGKGEEKKEYEIDVVVSDGRTVLIEVKSSLSKGELEYFTEQCRAFERLKGVKASRKVVVTAFPYPETAARAKEAGVEIITA